MGSPDEHLGLHGAAVVAAEAKQAAVDLVDLARSVQPVNVLCDDDTAGDAVDHAIQRPVPSGRNGVEVDPLVELVHEAPQPFGALTPPRGSDV